MYIIIIAIIVIVICIICLCMCMCLCLLFPFNNIIEYLAITIIGISGIILFVLLVIAASVPEWDSTIIKCYYLTICIIMGV